MEIYIIESSSNTRRLGEDLAKKINKGTILTLYGDLGSGKTTFVQGLAAGLGIEKRIISPTFVIVRSYQLKTQNSNVKTQAQNAKLFYHIDLYRVDSQQNFEGLGIEEILNGPENIVAIEWAEKLGDVLPKKRIDIRFEYIDEDKRKIVIKN